VDTRKLPSLNPAEQRRLFAQFGEEPGMIDVSGSIAGVGSKIMASRFASLAKPAMNSRALYRPVSDIPLVRNLDLANRAKITAMNQAQNQRRVGNVAAASAFTAPDMIQMVGR